VQGFHGIDEEVFLSLPVVISESGITSVLRQNLDEDEQSKVVASAKTLHEVIAGIKL